MSDPPRKEADIARKIRARGLALGHTPARIAEDIHDHCAPIFGTSRIKAHRLAGGVALSDVVAQVKALYEVEKKPSPKLGETLLSAYESGYKRPGPEYLHYLCSVYRVEPTDLGFRGPCVCGHRHDEPRPACVDLSDPLPREPGPLSGAVLMSASEEHRLVTRESSFVSHESEAHHRADGLRTADEGEEDTVLRRTLLQLLAGVGVTFNGRLVGAAETLRRRMDDTLVNATVSPSLLDQWEETVAGYGRQYMTTPPLRLLCDVLLDLSDIQRMCERRQPVELQERLCRVAAQLSGLSGVIMIDLGDHRLARSFFRTARTAADETGDKPLCGWVAVREALVPMYYGDPREALRLARKAQDLAGRAPSVAGAMAPMMEARALGQLVRRGRGDAAASAKRAIARGRAVFDRMSEDGQADTAFGYTERQLVFHTGDTYTGLGDTREGEPMLRRALSMYSTSEQLDRTLIQFDRAACLLAAGQPEEALRVGEVAVRTLPVDHRTSIVMHRARQLLAAAVARCGEIPAVRRFREVLAAPTTGGVVES